MSAFSLVRVTVIMLNTACFHAIIPLMHGRCSVFIACAITAETFSNGVENEKGRVSAGGTSSGWLSGA